MNFASKCSLTLEFLNCVVLVISLKKKLQCINKNNTSTDVSLNLSMSQTVIAIFKFCLSAKQKSHSAICTGSKIVSVK